MKYMAVSGRRTESKNKNVYTNKKHFPKCGLERKKNKYNNNNKCIMHRSD